MSIGADIEQFFARREQEVKDFFAARAPDFEKADEFAQSAVSDPLVSSGLSLLGFTPEAKAAVGDMLKRLDAEFVRVAAESHAAGHAEGAASVQQPEAAPGDASAEQPAPPDGEAAPQ